LLGDSEDQGSECHLKLYSLLEDGLKFTPKKKEVHIVQLQGYKITRPRNGSLRVLRVNDQLPSRYLSISHPLHPTSDAFKPVRKDFIFVRYAFREMIQTAIIKQT
jgi:hypothetical protein